MRTISLYIGGQPVDIDKQTLIQMTYSMEDLTNPTIVKNAYSQKVKLKGTAQNNRIFGSMFRLDRKTISGGGVGNEFSPVRKTPFAIYDDLGNILERGYIKLEDVTRKGADVEYQVTLYGGLGEFFYELSYREDGEKKTLADLDFFGSAKPDDELTFVIKQDAVRSAWDAMIGENDDPRWRVINFAPCYNGIPDNFASDVAIIRPTLAKLPNQVTQDGKTYTTKDGWALVELDKEYTEWETKDLRSYLQRPVYSVRSVIEAMCQPRNNGGHAVHLDPDFFNEDNPYWSKAWATLPVINTLEQEQVEGKFGITFEPRFVEYTDDFTGVVNASLLGGKSNIKVSVLPKINAPLNVNGSLTMGDNRVTYTLQVYTVNDGMLEQSVTIGNNGFFRKEGNEWVWSAGAIDFEITDADNVNEILLNIAVDESAHWVYDSNDKPVRTNGYGFGVVEATIDYVSYLNARTGTVVTKKLLFEGGATPADYLLSYAKLFGLHFIYDKAKKAITICSRNTLYTGETIDLSARVDRSQSLKIKPFSFDAKWYDLGFEYDEGAYAEEYKKITGKVYGNQRINTGFDFDANTKKLLDGNAFTGAVEVLGREKYYLNLRYIDGNTTYQIPSPFMDQGHKMVLYNGEDTTEVDINAFWNYVFYFDDTFKTYDAFSKLQLHDAEKGAVEQRDVLVFYDGSLQGGANTVYGNFQLTDDISAMGALNDGEPCWMLNGGTPITTIPRFGRYLKDYTGQYILQSWDFGTPDEIDIPEVVHEADAPIYPKAWAQYLADRYDVDSKVVTCKVDLRGIEVGIDLLRKFFYFDNAWWVLNKVSNYNLTGHAPVDCEFVKVKNRNNYSNGQIWQ